jgi:hypothetical protein
MAQRTKAQAEKLLQEQLEQERIEREEREHSLLFDGDVVPDAYSKVRAWCSTVGTEDSIGIYRQLPQKQEMFVCKIGADEFDPETIKARFGGGTFIIKGYDENNRIAMRQFISIEGDPIIEAAKPAPAIAAPAPSLESASLAQVMQDGFEKMVTLLAASQPKQKTTLEFLTEMKMLKEVFSPATATAQAPETGAQYMEAMKLGMEMGQMQGGDGNTMWATKMLELFGKPLADAWIASKMVPAPAARAQAGLPAPAATPAQLVEEENGMNIMIRGYIKLLGTGAEQNHPVEGYAEDIADHITPEFEAQLRAQNWQAEMAKYTNAVTLYPDWFTRLRELVIAYIDSDREEAAGLTGAGAGDKVPGHENGDPSKPANNGNTG